MHVDRSNIRGRTKVLEVRIIHEIRAENIYFRVINKTKIQTSCIINSFISRARFDMLKYLELVNHIEMKKA